MWKTPWAQGSPLIKEDKSWLWPIPHMPAWHTHTLVGMRATHGGHKDSPCPVGVWLLFTCVLYSCVLTHSRPHSALGFLYSAWCLWPLP